MVLVVYKNSDEPSSRSASTNSSVIEAITPGRASGSTMVLMVPSMPLPQTQAASSSSRWICRNEVDSALTVSGMKRAMNGVADRKGQRAADHRGDDADLDRVVDRSERQRVVEDAVEMHQRILTHVDQAGGVADEHEFAERRHDQGQARQDHDDQQIDDGEPEGEPAPRPEIEIARPKRLAGDG